MNCKKYLPCVAGSVVGVAIGYGWYKYERYKNSYQRVLDKHPFDNKKRVKLVKLQLLNKKSEITSVVNEVYDKLDDALKDLEKLEKFESLEDETNNKTALEYVIKNSVELIDSIHIKNDKKK